jgi:DNA-binding NtrC family response regulator
MLESLQDTLRRRFSVVTTTNGFAALRILAEEPCQAVLSDTR